MTLHYGKFTIHDYHAQHRILSVPEIFTYSSNIGTAKMALSLGVDYHKAFLKKLGQLDRLRTELPESAEPLVPKHWGELNTVTIAFGQGLSVAPLQAVMGIAALVNGGKLIPPTFLKRDQAAAERLATRVIKPETSEKMRYLMRLNVEKGTATRANVAGYYVGGKTGTSEKVVGGRYSKTKVLTSFTAIMPADKPQYLLLIMIDEPQGLAETHGFATSGWNAVPVGAKVIERVAPLLDIPPRFDLPKRRPLARHQLLLASRPRMEERAVRLAASSLACEVADRSMRHSIRARRHRYRRHCRRQPQGQSGLPVFRHRRRQGGRRALRQAGGGGRRVAVAAEQRPDGLPATIAFVPVGNARRALALAAAKFFPRQPGTIAAVTGTSGKTSVAAFTRQIWTALGLQAASIGTIGVVSPRGEKYGSLTTPDPVELHRTLDQLAGEGVTHLALEASSHGLDQHRLDGVRIAAGAFTNLSRDHLDYHPSIEAYLAAKLRLFEELIAPNGTAVIGVDDCYAGQVIEAAKKRGLKIMTVGERGSDIKLAGGAIDGFAQVITIAHGGREFKVKLPLVGAFQVQNAAVAAGLAIATGAEPARVFAALEHLTGAKGRLELAGSKNGAPIFIDYAHKPDALAKALASVAPLCQRQTGGGVRRRRRPRRRQTPDHGPHRGGTCRPRHRHRRQSAQRARRPRSAPPFWPPRRAPPKSATARKPSAPASPRCKPATCC